MEMINLSDICYFAKDRTEISSLSLKTYISTENMLQNRKGVTLASGLPTQKNTQAFKAGDVLVSNIRPYLKKIWLAEFDGGCSNDVLVLRPKYKIDSIYLYYILSSDSFFEYATTTARGTKMPRGDKDAIMIYKVPKLDYSIQKKIAKILIDYDKKSKINRRLVDILNEQLELIFKSTFIRFESFNGRKPDNWKTFRFSEFITETKEKCGNRSLPVYSITNEGLALRDEKFKKQVSNNVSNHKVIHYGDLVFGLNTDVLNWDVMEDEIGIMSPAYMSYHVSDNVSPIYLKYFIKTQVSKFRDLIKLSTRVGQGLDKDALLQKELYYPDDKSLNDFLELFKKYKDEISNLNKQSINLTELRDTLLPKLMSGEIDVTDLNI